MFKVLNVVFAIALIATLGNAALFKSDEASKFGGLKQIVEVFLFKYIINLIFRLKTQNSEDNYLIQLLFK